MLHFRIKYSYGKGGQPTESMTQHGFIGPLGCVDNMVQSFDEELDPSQFHVGPNWSIYRLSTRMRQANPDAYTPHFVPIGPFHHDNPHLQTVQIEKKQYMAALFARVGNNTSDTLHSCTSAMFDLEKDARNCYARGVTYSEYELAEILLVDGCFLLELFIRFYVRRFTWNQDQICPFFISPTHDTWLANDPIFHSNWQISVVQRDLVLMENQIPFFVLQTLFDTIIGRWRLCLPYDFLAGIAFDFFSTTMHARIMACRLDQPIHRKHLLNLLLNFYLPSSPSQTSREHIGPRIKGSMFAYMISATKLSEVGIRFRKAESDNLFDIKFERGVLQIPQLTVHEWTECFLRNLMAFEHTRSGNRQCFASYMFLMDRLIKNEDDVELLENEQIIINEHGGAQYIINFFKNMCKQLVVKEFYFLPLCQEVEVAYLSRCSRNWHEIKRNHCDSFLKIIAWVVAVVVLCLTALQSTMSVLDYLK